MGGSTVVPSGTEGAAATDKDASVGSDSRLALETHSHVGGGQQTLSCLSRAD